MMRVKKITNKKDLKGRVLWWARMLRVDPLNQKDAETAISNNIDEYQDFIIDRLKKIRSNAAPLSIANQQLGDFIRELG